ncbi:DNA polymerase III subunit beta [Paenibacillus mucilaginosus]|uniref:Beta sliding clamp n=3 Tax=Paenibacillus mucilaginosus TaxID=61624 RepID=H6NSQ9_9BACL|nr:DNA polymerase III subunit beta [Paenibacillus mucilaginosus]AEI38658.1 DnaN [Paenibacillus mucilaginosus KNP414]AFC26999.1 DnaN [Paenibacillus mucilaginosus 3016]AFH59131.1 DNA polymerase III subunit beta [Paenibacillus mucilaginosus K02]MCG7213433.1 DNA polymerase III subunit beta [Paenibacillus mucilaginosus]WDM27748.1 DNA polymerase III subunit beta [Paenibacillus mucilaginosus]
MKLTVLKEYLNESIQHVSKAISSKTTIPILGGIKIDADSTGMTLTASDTDISIQSFIPKEKNEISVIDLKQTGSVVLPSKFFVEIIRKLPAQQVEIEVKEGFHTTIRSGSSEIQLVGLDPEEYPIMPGIEENKRIQIPSDLLKTMIKQTAFAVSTNEATPILTGILWTIADGKLKFTACDRHRLASRETSIDTEEGLVLNNVSISGKTLNELSKILPDQNTLIDVVFAENQVLFKMSSILFYSRILDGTYPDTSKLIPQSYQTELVINTDDLADAIDRAYLLSREEKTNIVKLIMREDQTIEISSSSSELGKVTEELTASRLNGELLRISFNSKYMLDALKVMDSEQIHIGFTGAMQPIIIRPDENSSLLQLILPYRTTG